MEALLAFAAALLSLRLAALLAVRWRDRRRPELAAWSAALLAYAVASGALAWGAAAGWDTRAFRVYYLFGGLLTAALLGLGVTGTVAVLAVALVTIKRRPLGNALIVAGVAVAAAGTALSGLGAAKTAIFVAIAALLLYGGFTASPRKRH